MLKLEVPPPIQINPLISGPTLTVRSIALENLHHMDIVL